MPANDAFTAGVRPGGLTSSTEIRLLLCYLVKNAGPIARQEIENALMEEALVNYFEIGSCLDDITRQQLVTVQDNVYSITDKGRKVAQELAYDLPRSVRERAVAAVLRCQTWARKEAKYSASITEKPDGHCSVRCTVKGLDEALFCLDLGTPDRLSAELVKKQFILKGNEIYQLLVNKIPPQRQLDIRSRKKIIVCEYCGRIMIDPELAGITPEQKVEVVKEKPVRAKRKIVHIGSDN